MALNFVKLYIGDYMRDTGTLTVSEHGAYVLMLLHHYGTERPLPVGRDLHRLLRAESKADREAIDSVAIRFWTESEGGLTNKRAAEEMHKAGHQREVNRVVGRLGGRPKRNETESVTESPTDSLPNRNPNHSQTPEKTIAAKAAHPGKPGSERFDAFWKAYPRKVGKDAARKAFDKRKPDDVLLQSFIRAVESQARSEAWRKDGGQFIPHPATWLNEGRWMDEGLISPVAAPPEVWKPEPKLTPEEIAAAAEVRRRIVPALKRVGANA